ncbi:MAG: DUF3971 domain-containing protein [Proteobacteria bacterium]|nr:DUF3971 domain-containing protein [Pseudomonadota bacterium]
MFALVAIACLVNIISFFVWVAIAPRQVPYLSEQVERAFSSIRSDYGISIGNTVLQWDGWKKGYGIHIHNAKLMHKDGAQVASFPDVALGFSVTSLLKGQVRFHSVEIIGARITVDVSSDASVEKTDEVPDVLVAFNNMQSVVAQNITPVEQLFADLPIRRLHFVKATVYTKDKSREGVFDIPRAEFHMKQKGDSVAIDASLENDAFGEKIFMNMKGDLSEKGDSEIELSVSDVLPRTLIGFFPEQVWLKKVPLSFGARLSMKMNSTEGIKNAVFDVQSKDSDATTISLKGGFRNHTQYMGTMNAPELDADILIKDIKFDDLWKYWPEEVAANPREWMSQHMKNGIVGKAEATVKVMPEDLTVGTLKKESLKASISFRDIDMNYFEKLPPVKGSGEAVFDGQTMRLTLKDPVMKHSKIMESDIAIYNLGLGNEEIEIKGVLVGDANDLADFLVLRGGSGSDGGFPSIKQISGEAKTRFRFRFPLLKDLDVASIDFDATSELKDIRLPKVVKNIDMTDAKLKVEANPKKFEVSGDARLNGGMLNIYYFEDASSGFISKYAVKGKMTAEQITGFDVPVGDIMSGAADVSLESEKSGNVERLIITAKLDDADIHVKDIGFNKKLGKPAMLKLDLSQPDNAPITINQLSLTGYQLEVTGSGSYDPKADVVRDLHLLPVKFEQNDFKLDVSYDDKKGYTIRLLGAAVDVTNLLDDSGPAAEPQKKPAVDKKEKKKSYSISIDTDTFYLANDEKLEDVSGMILCPEGKCSSGSIKGFAGEKKQVLFTISKSDNTRTFALKSDNAGSLMRGAGLFKNVVGGTLEASANIDDSKADAPFEGKFVIKDLRAVKAPILANMLSLLSLGGILDLLNGQGIVFDKIGGEFAYSGDNFIMKDIRAAGSSIGLTVDGEANLATSQMIIRGNIIPAYSLNRFVGNVPLVGNFLTGGDGQGIIAARYKISGTMDKPEVSVNPFSILTPGFLRNIWGIPSESRLPSEPDDDVQGPVTPEQMPKPAEVKKQAPAKVPEKAKAADKPAAKKPDKEVKKEPAAAE